MKLSESTIAILKNFAAIQPNIVFREGNTIKTLAEAKNIIASAKIDTDIPETFGIYDLSEFLGTLAIVDNPTLSFKKEYALIEDGSGRAKIKYFFSDPDMLTTPTRDLPEFPADVKFTLDVDTLNKLKKAAATLGHTELAITPAGEGLLSFMVCETDNKTSNTYELEVPGEYSSYDFCLIFNINNLKMIPGEYDVEISSKLISHFQSNTQEIEYWVACEKTSTF